jgi:hypothetical protein
MNTFIASFAQDFDDDVENIVEMFKKDKGPINFQLLPVDYDSDYFKNYESLSSLRTEDINDICSSLRQSTKEKIASSDVVVIITPKKLDIPVISTPKEKDWNSVFISHNIAVNCSRWDKITEGRPYLAVAHQIIENIFQDLSHIEINSQKLYKDIHVDSEVCINDYCKNLNETKGKIRSGFICKSCTERALKFTDKSYVLQIKNILKRISERLNDNYDFTPTKEELRVKIDQYADIYLGGKRINFGKSKIAKLCYLFYLINHNTSIGAKDFKGSPEIQKKFISLSSLLGETFTDQQYYSYVRNIRTHHTRSFEKILNGLENESVSPYFKFKSETIKQDVYVYKIEVLEDNIEIPEDFQKYRLN